VIIVVDYVEGLQGTANLWIAGNPRVQLRASNETGPGWRYYAGGNFPTGTEDDSVQLITAVFDDINNNSELRENGAQRATGSPGTGSAVLLMLTQPGQDKFGFFEIHEGVPSNGLSAREQEVADMWDITI
jgi:hypothetical protein